MHPQESVDFRVSAASGGMAAVGLYNQPRIRVYPSNRPVMVQRQNNNNSYGNVATMHKTQLPQQHHLNSSGLVVGGAPGVIGYNNVKNYRNQTSVPPPLASQSTAPNIPDASKKYQRQVSPMPIQPPQIQSQNHIPVASAKNRKNEMD